MSTEIGSVDISDPVAKIFEAAAEWLEARDIETVVAPRLLQCICKGRVFRAEFAGDAISFGPLDRIEEVKHVPVAGGWPFFCQVLRTELGAVDTTPVSVRIEREVKKRTENLTALAEKRTADVAALVGQKQDLEQHVRHLQERLAEFDGTAFPQVPGAWREGDATYLPVWSTLQLPAGSHVSNTSNYLFSCPLGTVGQGFERGLSKSETSLGESGRIVSESWPWARLRGVFVEILGGTPEDVAAVREHGVLALDNGASTLSLGLIAQAVPPGGSSGTLRAEHVKFTLSGVAGTFSLQEEEEEEEAYWCCSTKQLYTVALTFGSRMPQIGKSTRVRLTLILETQGQSLHE